MLCALDIEREEEKNVHGSDDKTTLVSLFKIWTYLSLKLRNGSAVNTRLNAEPSSVATGTVAEPRQRYKKVAKFII